MWLKKGTRKDFLEILGGNQSKIIGGVREVNNLSSEIPILDEVYFVWEFDPQSNPSLPVLLILPDGQLKDFLAWASTFFPGYRPITAYCRIIEWKTANRLQLKNRIPQTHGLEKACTGVIIAEALSQYSQQVDPQYISPFECTSTYSYCMTRSLFLDYLDEDIDYITNRWAKARNITKQSDRKLNHKSMRDIWIVIRALSQRNKSFYIGNSDTRLAHLIEACSQIIKFGEITNYTWTELVFGSNELAELRNEMKGTKEQRVLCIERSLSSSSYKKLNDLSQSFLFGYLVSLVSIGSMEHLNLIWPYVDRYPTAMLWYGLCAGLYGKIDMLSEFKGLGHRLIRDLNMPESTIFGRPRADIAIDELEVLFTGDTPSEDFRKGSKNYLLVEISPGISTSLAWPEKGKSYQKEMSTGHIKPETYEDLLMELGFLIKRMNEIYGNLSSHTDTRNKISKQQRGRRKN